VGCFQSQVLGVGPQIGYIFPIGGMQGYLNLKAYGEFRRLRSAFRLECLADARHLAAGAYAARNDATSHHQVAARRGRSRQRCRSRCPLLRVDHRRESPLRRRDLVSDRHGMSLESRYHFEQLEIAFLAL
jgi:hypothetical protein